MAIATDHAEPEVLEDETSDRTIDDGVAGVSSWGISIVLHAIILLIMAFVVYQSMQDQPDAQVTQNLIPPAPDKPKEIERALVDTTVTIESQVIVQEPVLHEFALPEEKLQTEDEVVAEQPIKGREEAVAMAEMGGIWSHMATGAGSGASGAMGWRTGGGPGRAAGKYGGSKASQDAVAAALRWFVRHQSPNGQWDVDGYPQNCQEAGPKCEPGSYKTTIEGDVACTGYALLCFLGHGYDHRSPNQFQRTVRQGIDWLVSVQQADGLLGTRNYEHPVAVMALAEAYAMTSDPALRDPVQRGVQVILARQAKGTVTTAQTGTVLGEYGLGWDYVKPNLKRMDSSVSGWNVMALKAAKAGGIDIGDGIGGALAWVTGAWEAMNKQIGIDVKNLNHYGESQFPYTWDGTSNTVVTHDGDLTCVGLLCSVFLGAKPGEPMLDTMANWCFNHQTPATWPCDTYFMYYNTLSMFQVQGDHWKKWNSQVRDMLVGAQRKGPACFDGSWDPAGAGAHHVSEVGRLLVTAYCCLSLEVYYRFKPLEEAIKER